ncbi:MAG: hypothetical protein IMF19_09390 [Proteobacteria bacterium]|nr:hypothetical protein [Pseudomonadota bacterium]
MTTNEKDWKTKLKEVRDQFSGFLKETIVDLSCLEVNSVLVSSISADHPLDDREFLQQTCRDLTDWFKRNKIDDKVQKPLEDSSVLELEKICDKDKRLKSGGLCLFGIEDGNLEEELNKDLIPEMLKKMFQTNGIPLSETATIKKEDDGKWLITDKENKNTYLIRKDEGKLNIYEDRIKQLFEDIDACLTHKPGKLDANHNRSEYRRHLRYLKKYLDLYCSDKWDLDKRMLEGREHQQLRKLWELVGTEYIYAQTVLDLDGDIVSRINDRLFRTEKGRDNAEELMRFHKWNVEGGVNYRNGLMNTFVQIIRALLGK